MVWQDLGPIRSGIKYQDAFERNEDFIAAHPNYSYYTNNCYHFAQSLYSWMLDPAAPVKRQETNVTQEAEGLTQRDSRVVEQSIPALFDRSVRIEA